MQFSSSQNIDFSLRYFQKCVKKRISSVLLTKKDQYTLDSNFEFEKKMTKILFSLRKM